MDFGAVLYRVRSVTLSSAADRLMVWRYSARSSASISALLFCTVPFPSISAALHQWAGQPRLVHQWIVPRVKKLIMPPLALVKVPACRRHDAHEREAVALGRHGDVGACVVRERAQLVEAAAHVE